jgi:N-methylhydantoinase A/oxoprolinase/acetone carboxylase beta subunit
VNAALTGDTAALEPAPLYERDDLRPGDGIAGPAIIAQLDATTDRATWLACRRRCRSEPAYDAAAASAGAG